ncbi:bacteriophage abortive infection AbiH family protein [Romboutsia sp. 1001216sp1]|uniref:bacteriophage abortive infection AbiH family protein n=1 Tax=Romboutsia sp. 1001216sp1 TaxID=2986997 RepID=UPI002330841E|nr:bacteriophage abortive infection AbiH family protein [Romboutsia sp. 1001216sp1]MDB8791835.1 bacteriophage abortive infection AbiH family protein [Romboutsia sp. 1001216sp1]
MSKLFIIGNGFDLDHGLKTSYNHFHDFLKDICPESTDEFCFPNLQINSDGSVDCDITNTINFIRYIISNVEGDKWTNLESSLAYLDFSDFCYDLKCDFFDKDDEDDVNLWHKAYDNENIMSDITIPIFKIKPLFADWISTINLSSVKSKLDFKTLIDQNSKFLTFNYTLTLENVYNVKNVCHIHGKQGENLLFGHDNLEEYDYSSLIGAENICHEIFSNLKKDTRVALSNNIEFFNSLDSSIDSIYSFGFSFGNVDLLYIRKICEILPTENITWFLNEYDKDSMNIYKEKIINCGFNGKFDSFIINS